MPNPTVAHLQKLNKMQIFILNQICKVLFESDANEFIKNERVDYAKIKETLYGKYPNDSHLKVWDLVKKHYDNEYVVLNETKNLSLPLAFNCVVCFHQKEFKG